MLVTMTPKAMLIVFQQSNWSNFGLPLFNTTYWQSTKHWQQTGVATSEILLAGQINKANTTLKLYIYFSKFL